MGLSQFLPTRRRRLIRRLVFSWYEARQWAEQLLLSSFESQTLLDVLRKTRGKHLPIPGSDWMVNGHGIGFNIYRDDEIGGIDFDIDKHQPDPWRLRWFAIAQHEDGVLTGKDLDTLKYESDDWATVVESVVKRNGSNDSE